MTRRFILSVERVAKRFGADEAVRELSFDARTSEAFDFLGGRL